MSKLIQKVDKVALVEHYIISLRDEKVILDFQIAMLYGVETRALMQAVKRNIDRFPDDFMFQLTEKEEEYLRSQNVISNIKKRCGRRYLPYAFTEQGIAMLSSVLRSSRAVKVNIEIMRAFVKIHKMFESNKDLRLELEKLEQKYDSQFKIVFEAIRKLMQPPELSKKNQLVFRNGLTLQNPTRSLS